MATDKEDFHFSFLFSRGPLFLSTKVSANYFCATSHGRSVVRVLLAKSIKNSFELFIALLTLSLQNDSIEWESFTFDKFYQIYKIICPRSDIDDLFQSM